MLYMQLGVVYFHLDEYGKAVRAFQEAILANAVHPLPHGGLAEIYTRTHNISQGIKHWQKYLDRSADDTYARQQLAICHARRGLWVSPQGGLGNLKSMDFRGALQVAAILGDTASAMKAWAHGSPDERAQAWQLLQRSRHSP